MAKRKRSSGAARAERAKKIQSLQSVPARRLSQSELPLEFRYTSPPEYCEVYLDGLSARDDESVEPDASGVGIVQLVKTDQENAFIGVWMSPTTQVTTSFPELLPKANEYTRNETMCWSLDKEVTDNKVEIWTIPDYATWPHPRRKEASASENIIQDCALGPEIRFTRSGIDRDGRPTIKHRLCAVCENSLDIESYVYCHRCHEAFDRKCTTARDRQPFRLGKCEMHDYNNEIVECPRCCKDPAADGTHIKLSENFAFGESECIQICIDIGSQSPKVGIKLRGRHISQPAFVPLSTVLGN
jgi:hypothetical protein